MPCEIGVAPMTFEMKAKYSDLEELRNGWCQLYFFQRWFFPKEIEEAFMWNNKYQMATAFNRHVWFFQCWFVPCLERFSKGPSMNVYHLCAKNGLLTGGFAYENFNAVASHCNPQSMVESLRKLTEYGLLATGTSDARANHEVVITHRYPSKMAEALCKLQTAGLLDNKSASVYRAALAVSHEPEIVTTFILNINSMGLIDDNFVQKVLFVLAQKEDAPKRTQQIGSSNFHSNFILSAENADKVIAILKLLPERERFAVVTDKNHLVPASILHIAASRLPDTLKLILELLPEEERLAAMAARTIYKTSVLDIASYNPLSLKAILEVVPVGKLLYEILCPRKTLNPLMCYKAILRLLNISQCVEAIHEENNLGTVLHTATETEEFLKATLEILPIPMRLSAVKKTYKTSDITSDICSSALFAACFHKTLNVILELLPENERVAALTEKNNDGCSVLEWIAESYALADEEKIRNLIPENFQEEYQKSLKKFREEFVFKQRLNRCMHDGYYDLPRKKNREPLNVSATETQGSNAAFFIPQSPVRDQVPTELPQPQIQARGVT